jgi:hypothetical protein
MITFAWLGLLVVVVWGAYRLAEDIVRRSLNSFQTADRVWSDLKTKSQEITDAAQVPEEVCRIVYALTASAGCGCYVRGMIMHHYLPALSTRKPDTPSEQRWSESFDKIAELPIEVQRKLAELIMLVFVYDSFKNPVQGWIFRRIVRSAANPSPNFAARTEAELTAFSVLSRKGKTLIGA